MPRAKMGKFVPCEGCGKKVYKTPCALKKFRHHFCSLHCMHANSTRKHLSPGWSRKIKQQIGKCQVCGWSEPDILEIHHKDDNPNNNNHENLLVVCPNCHARLRKRLIDTPATSILQALENQ